MRQPASIVSQKIYAGVDMVEPQVYCLIVYDVREPPHLNGALTARADQKGKAGFVAEWHNGGLYSPLHNSPISMTDDLSTASPEQRDNREFVLSTVRACGVSIKYASDRLRSDTEVALHAVRENGRALEYVGDDLRANRKVVLAAIGRWAIALQFASPELRDDRDIVLKAVRKWGLAIKHASDRLRSDRELAIVAIRRNSAALKYTSDALQAELEGNLYAGRQLGTGAVTLAHAANKRDGTA